MTILRALLALYAIAIVGTVIAAFTARWERVAYYGGPWEDV